MTFVKRLLFPGILLAATIGIVASQGLPKQRPTGQQRTSEVKENKQPEQNRQAPNIEPLNTDHTGTHSSDIQTPKPSEDLEIQRKLAKFTKWLVIVGALQFAALIIQAIAFWYTLGAVRSQANLMGIHAEHLDKLAAAAKENAEAARLSAQAVINSERPWITVTVDRDPEVTNRFFYRITNKGRTPASVISAFSERRIVELPDNLPIPPTYSSPMYSPVDDLIVADGVWIDHPGFSAEAVIGHPQGARKMFESSAKFICFYGQITYRDSLGNGDFSEHYTRWCFAYDVFRKTMVASGPHEYRSKT